MNIFAVNTCPETAARSLCDAHVVKMTLETAQLLCTHGYCQGFLWPGQYRPTHVSHPCRRWLAGEDLAPDHQGPQPSSLVPGYDMRSVPARVVWLGLHGLALAEEFAHRYGRRHKSGLVIEEALVRMVPRSLWYAITSERRHLESPNFAQAMPDEYRHHNSVTAYRRYYVYKALTMPRFAYTRRDPPYWLAHEVPIVADHGSAQDPGQGFPD